MDSVLVFPGIAFPVVTARDGVYRKIYKCLLLSFQEQRKQFKRCDHRTTTALYFRSIRKEVFSSVDAGITQKHSRMYASTFENKTIVAVMFCMCPRVSEIVQNKMVFWVPNRTQGCMVDALTLRGDEGRGVAAISEGEAYSNL